MIPLVVAVGGVIAGTVALGRPRTLDGVGPTEFASRTWPSGASISIIVPARDEQSSLPHLLESITAIDRSSIREVIVVDDGSTDETASIAGAAGATVVTAPPPPPGWLGKSWACSLGVAQATGSHLLFLDADVRLAADAIDRLLLAAETGGGGLTSVQPHHCAHRGVEQLSAYFNAASVLGSGAFSSRPARRPLAFGPCLLTSRADYERSGGHAAVRGEIVEDIALARRYHGEGLPVSCWLGGRAVQFRMYPDGFRSLVQGWTKNIAAGAGSTGRRSALATGAWIAASLSVALALAGGLRGWAVDGMVPGTALLAWAITAIHLWFVLRRLGSFHAATALLFPAPLVFFVAVFVRSAVLQARHRPVRWRGRDVQPAAR